MPKTKKNKNGSSGSNGDGNTKHPRCNGGVHWCFTWNNPQDLAPAILLEVFHRIAKAWVFQYEMGDQGTLHLQGYVQFKVKTRPIEKFEEKKIHWEVCRNIEKSILYCQKKETRVEGTQVFKHGIKAELIDPLEGLTLWDWQADIIAIINGTPHNRRIYWFWESDGGVGKTVFTKHLAIHAGALVLGGKASDIKCGIQRFLEQGRTPDLLIFDIPRTTEAYVSYEALEKAKDGCFFSGKYESGMCLYNTPHVLVFANFPPNEEKLSRDRWVIKELPKREG